MQSFKLCIYANVSRNRIIKNRIVIRYTGRDPCATSRITQKFSAAGKSQPNYESPAVSSALLVTTYYWTDGYWWASYHGSKRCGYSSGRKRKHYTVFSGEDRAVIGRYAAENSKVRSTFSDLSESRVHLFVALNIIHSACNNFVGSHQSKGEVLYSTVIAKTQSLISHNAYGG